jgi:hypothetical protein
MQHFFLRLYVAAQNRKLAAREEGFVTAEHLAIAVVGVVIVFGVAALFRSQLEGAIGGLFSNFNSSGETPTP